MTARRFCVSAPSFSDLCLESLPLGEVADTNNLIRPVSLDLEGRGAWLVSSECRAKSMRQRNLRSSARNTPKSPIAIVGCTELLPLGVRVGRLSKGAAEFDSGVKTSGHPLSG
jgi:hypothetical protein